MLSPASSAHELLQTRLLRDPGGIEREVSATGSAQLVQALAAIASAFHPESHGPVVEAVLALRWAESEALAIAVLSFALELVSAVPSFVKLCIDALVITFLPTVDQAKGTQGEASAAVQERVHEALRGILRACPLSVGNLYAAIKEHMPQAHRSVYKGPCEKFGLH